jgi:glucose/arabinose dehydrogenase
MNRVKGCVLILIGITIIFLIGGLILYRIVASRANFRPILGSGSTAPLQLPADFEANVFAEGLNGPRFIAFGPDDILYVADRGNGRIVALPDMDGDGRADEVRIFAEGLDQPHSLAFYEGAWFVGVPTGVIRLEDADGDGVAEDRTVLIDDYPTSGSHRTRTIKFLPDGRMVVSLGSSCNVCQEADPRRASVLVYDGPDAGSERIFASGLRNAVGLAVHPDTGELWVSNNGRDLMGDDLPPETVYIVQDGADYGWPRCHSGTVPDPDFGDPNACDGVPQPIVQMQAHSAPLDLVFYTGDSFPDEYQNDLFIAFHGSWNRSVPTGYKVVRLPLDGSQVTGPVEDFAVGWLNEDTGQATGRPVGLAIGPDGALYISDDKSGFIYRVSYESAS